jgi:hypothetical protein
MTSYVLLFATSLLAINPRPSSDAQFLFLISSDSCTRVDGATTVFVTLLGFGKLTRRKTILGLFSFYVLRHLTTRSIAVDHIALRFAFTMRLERDREARARGRFQRVVKAKNGPAKNRCNYGYSGLRLLAGCEI